MNKINLLSLSAWVLLLGQVGSLQGQSLVIKEGQTTKEGFIRHILTTEYQQGPTEIQVLLPDRLVPGRRYPVLFVLPVEVGLGSQYGNGLLEIKKLDLHNKYGIICVQLTFSHLPWYADHPTNRQIRQETYVLKEVLPFLERHYPVRTDMAGRWLLGFSKSGWGAFSLLLRHPGVFGKAAAWDAPLDMALPNRYGMKDIFGSDANFAGYRITTLLEKRAADLKGVKRLYLVGYCNFREHHQTVHQRLDQLRIPHDYRDELRRPHTWHSGWVAEGVRWLAEAPEK